MKSLIFAALMALALPVFAAFVAQPAETIVLTKPIPPNTVIREHSSFKEGHGRTVSMKRTHDYPTQIVRMDAALNGPAQTCDDVFQKIDEFFTNYITYDKFFYNSLGYCVYDQDTKLAKRFMINSYFDPLDDEAITYLEKYLAEHNGRDLLGAPFNVEKAQGLIVSLNIDAGLEDYQNSTLLRLQHDNSSHYFPSNYAMRLDLITDVMQRFYSNDPDLILPFLDKWFVNSGWVGAGTLRSSDYVELQPELIFLMDKGPKIFTSLLRMYYSHHCSVYANKRCL